MENLDFSQTRSFNLGIALETSIEAAMIYDDLVYAQKSFGTGYFYRSDEQMLKRFPMLSKSTIRRHIAKLIEGGYISTKVKKVDNKPTRYVQIEHSLMVKMTKTKEIVKMTNSINIETKEETKSTHAKGQELLALVNKITGRGFRTLPPRGWKQTLDTFTLVEIESALTALAADDWHKPKLKDFSIEYFVKPVTIDRFLEKAPKTAREIVLEQEERARRRMAGN